MVMTVGSHWLDRGGLGPLAALLFVKAHLASKSEAFDPAHHAVSVKIDVAVIFGGDPSRLGVRLEVSDPAMRRQHRRLHLAAHAAHVVFQLPTGCVERVPNGNLKILVRMRFVGGSPNENVFTGDANINAHTIEASLVVVPVWRFDDDPTARDPVAEILELFDARAHVGFYGLAWGHVTEGDLWAYLHVTEDCERRAVAAAQSRLAHSAFPAGVCRGGAFFARSRGGVLAGKVPPTGMKLARSGEMASESQLVAKVRRCLRDTPRGDLLGQGVSVLMDEEDLVLAGEVDGIADKKTALEAAAAVIGVGAIIDRLHIRAAVHRSDRELLEDTKRLLGDEWALSACLVQSRAAKDHNRTRALWCEGFQGAIAITVENGVITLDGEVPGLLEKRLAGALAWSVPGCRDVIDALGVEPPEPDSDVSLARAIRVVLARLAPAAASVQIEAHRRRVTLTGEVERPEEAADVERIVWGIFGVDSVSTRLSPRMARFGHAPSPP
jgi:osmotically-inducible protein OsmY